MSSTIALCALFALQVGQVGPERGTPWYWPVGDPFEPSTILQAYGQYETVMGIPAGTMKAPSECFAEHKGLDVEADEGDPVRSPVAGIVTKVWLDEDPACYIEIRVSKGWSLRVAHIARASITHHGKWPVSKGDLLGTVASWDSTTKPEGFEHVHLELFRPVATPRPDGSLVATANPLPYLGGRPDSSSPFFRTIDTGHPEQLVGFVPDIADSYGASLGALDFKDPMALPQQDLDVLVRVGDYFSTVDPILISFPILIATPFSRAVTTIGFRLFLENAGPLLAPAMLSLRISRETPTATEPAGTVVFEKTIELLGDVTTSPYLIPTTETEPSRGWPTADFYCLATHSEAALDTWQAGQSGAGTYRVEVTAEDLAGNLASHTTTATVLAP